MQMAVVAENDISIGAPTEVQERAPSLLPRFVSDALTIRSIT